MVSSGDITLSKDRGINPRMSTCVRCGSDGTTLALIGDSDHLFDCRACGKKVLGKKRQRKCPGCGVKGSLAYDRRLGESEPIPMGLCQTCEDSDKELEEVVKEGGVYWKCADCDRSGALRAQSQLAQAVRKQLGVEAPNPAGCEFTKDDCPACGPNAVEQA
jgi:rubrerythrin